MEDPPDTPINGESQQPTALHLFSGPMDRKDGLAAYLYAHGWHCTDIDVVNASIPGESKDKHDLCSIALWDQIRDDIAAGHYQCVGFGTPCETASRARRGPPGPRPLRSTEHIYGLPKSQLTQAESEQVRTGTFFALQSSQTAIHAIRHQVSWWLENPDPSGNPVSLYNLPEWQALASMPEVQHIDFHQCPMGSETAKPTRILFYRMDLSSLQGSCTHEPREWTFNDHAGRSKTTWGPHPPLAGRRREDGCMATKAAAAYPALMNQNIAQAMAHTMSTSWTDHNAVCLDHFPKRRDQIPIPPVGNKLPDPDQPPL